MLVELFEFQNKALGSLRERQVKAQRRYKQDGEKSIIPFTAPTGAGKTIIMSAFIEALYTGDTYQGTQNDAIVLWISDAPELNEQSKDKLYKVADKLRNRQVVTIDEQNFKAVKLQLGTIYYVNTQKFGVNSNLVKYSDSRNYTGWDFMRNTIEEYGDKLVVIIDEAHRGAKPNEIGTQMSIMQKFVLGSETDNMPSMPLIIGMSATLERFNELVKSADSTLLPKVEVTPDEVRASGLLKDEIKIHHPQTGEAFAEMTYLAEAAKDWKSKCQHWEAYRQHEDVEVRPALVVQVKNKKDDKLSETNLDECLRIIEAHTGISLRSGEVVHTFDTKESITVNGLEVRYLDPSRISESKDVKVIFFKDNLSTGWDCPRAETMMSFKVASGYTNIAQLLGRMVRTPLQKRIETDDTLNEVQLFLPNFDAVTVERVKRELEGTIPTHVETNPSPKQVLKLRGNLPCGLSRQEVFEVINAARIDNYSIPQKGVTDYRKALFKLCHLLVRTRLCRDAVNKLKSDIVGQITDFVKNMQDAGTYQHTMEKIRTMNDMVLAFDALGKSAKEAEDGKFVLSESDIDTWSENVETRFGKEGILNAYRKARMGEYDCLELRLQFILYANNQSCMERLDKYCKEAFYEYYDKYRQKLEAFEEEVKREYEKIVKAHVSTLPFDLTLPDLMVTSKHPEGTAFTDHLYVDGEGKAVFKLNEWEQAVLDVEQKKEGFVCWVRNVPNKDGFLCIQYLNGDELRPHFPDFIVVRRVDEQFEFVLLEPHYTGYADSVPKLKGMAAYSEHCSAIKRNEMMRIVDIATGKKVESLNAASSSVRNDIKHLMSQDDLNNLFTKYNNKL